MMFLIKEKKNFVANETSVYGTDTWRNSNNHKVLVLPSFRCLAAVEMDEQKWESNRQFRLIVPCEVKDQLRDEQLIFYVN